MMGHPDTVDIREIHRFHYDRTRQQLNDADSADIAIEAHKISDMLDMAPVGSVAMYIYRAELLAICDIQCHRAAARAVEQQHATQPSNQDTDRTDAAMDMPDAERHIDLTGDETGHGMYATATLTIGPYLCETQRLHRGNARPDAPFEGSWVGKCDHAENRRFTALAPYTSFTIRRVPPITAD